MNINNNKPHLWKNDIKASVDMYNKWFMTFAPKAFRSTRINTTKEVETALKLTSNLTNISASILKAHPEVLSTLRMSTCPPIATDRLIGLAGVSPNLVKKMEKQHKIPPRMDSITLTKQLNQIGVIINKMADLDIFDWLETKSQPTSNEVHRASTIIADRLCGSVANPIIRNAQEKRQLKAIKTWLINKGYSEISSASKVKYNQMKPGTFSFHVNVPVKVNQKKEINLAIDCLIQPKSSLVGNLPILIEAKSAGDFTNVNKRRKEEAAKMTQLTSTYGTNVQFILFLCGYFDSGYLGYEAAEGIDWVWEHRIDDFAKLNL